MPILNQPVTSDEPNIIESMSTLQHQDSQVRDPIVSNLGPCKVDAAVQTLNKTKDATSQTEPTKPSKLSTTVNPIQSIPPRKVYHLALINVSKSLYQRHPSELTREEFKTFNQYLHDKRNNGEPVVLDPVYLPTSVRDCLHCGHPT